MVCFQDKRKRVVVCTFYPSACVFLKLNRPNKGIYSYKGIATLTSGPLGRLGGLFAMGMPQFGPFEKKKDTIYHILPTCILNPVTVDSRYKEH